jgi:hypothetical protein
VLEAVFVLLESLSHSRRIFIGSHSLPPLWFALSVLHSTPTYRREYENFTHLPRDSIDAMFQRFTVIMNNMRANVVVLPYDDHDEAVKLLHSLDRTMWSGKVEDILETLTVDELFSKI